MVDGGNGILLPPVWVNNAIFWVAVGHGFFFGMGRTAGLHTGWSPSGINNFVLCSIMWVIKLSHRVGTGWVRHGFVHQLWLGLKDT